MWRALRAIAPAAWSPSACLGGFSGRVPLSAASLYPFEARVDIAGCVRVRRGRRTVTGLGNGKLLLFIFCYNCYKCYNCYNCYNCDTPHFILAILGFHPQPCNLGLTGGGRRRCRRCRRCRSCRTCNPSWWTLHALISIS